MSYRAQQHVLALARQGRTCLSCCGGAGVWTLPCRGKATSVSPYEQFRVKRETLRRQTQFHLKWTSHLRDRYGATGTGVIRQPQHSIPGDHPIPGRRPIPGQHPIPGQQPLHPGVGYVAENGDPGTNTATVSRTPIPAKPLVGKLAAELRAHMTSMGDPLVPLLQGATRNTNPVAYLDVLALTLEEKLTPHQAALLCYEACTLAPSVGGSNATVVPMLFLVFIDQNAEALNGVAGLMLKSIYDSLYASEKVGVDRSAVAKKANFLLGSILNRLQGLLFDMPAEQLCCLAAVSKDNLSMLNDITFCLSHCLDSIPLPWLVSAVSCLSHHGVPSKDAASGGDTSDWHAASPVPKFLESALETILPRASELDLHSLELLFHAFSSGKLPATCNVMDALASCILHEGHTIPFDHVLYFMEKALATQGNNVPAERVLDCLSLSFSPSAVRKLDLSSLNRGVRFLQTLSHTRSSIVDILRLEAMRRVSWMGADDVRVFLGFFAAAGVHDKTLNGVLLSQFERMTEEGPLNIPAVLEILNIISKPNVPVESTEFMSWFLNDTLAVALQPGVAPPTVQAVSALLRGVRDLSKLTSISANLLVTCFEACLVLEDWSAIKDPDTLATPAIAWIGSAQREALFECIRSVVQQYVNRLQAEVQNISADSLAAVVTVLDQCHWLSSELHSSIFNKLTEEDMLKSCSGSTLLSILRVNYLSSSTMGTSLTLKIPPAVLSECLSSTRFHFREIAMLTSCASYPPDVFALGYPFERVLDGMSLSDVIMDVQHVEERHVSPMFVDIMLSALYKLHDQVTTTNFVTAVDILMVKFPLYIGIHRLLEKFFQELVTRSGIEKISDMVSTALSVFERAEQNANGSLAFLTKALREEYMSQIALLKEVPNLCTLNFIHSASGGRTLFPRVMCQLVEEEPLSVRSINPADCPLLLKFYFISHPSDSCHDDVPSFLLPIVKMSLQIYGNNPAFLMQLAEVMNAANRFPKFVLNHVVANLPKAFRNQYANGAPDAETVATFMLHSKVNVTSLVESLLDFLKTPQGAYQLRKSSTGVILYLLAELSVPASLPILQQYGEELSTTLNPSSDEVYLALVYALTCLEGNLFVVQNLIVCVLSNGSIAQAQRVLDIHVTLYSQGIRVADHGSMAWRKQVHDYLVGEHHAMKIKQRSLSQVFPESVIPNKNMLCHTVDALHQWYFDGIIALDRNGKMCKFNDQDIKLSAQKISINLGSWSWPKETFIKVALILVPEASCWRSGEAFGSILLRKRQMEGANYIVQLIHPSFLEHDEETRAIKVQAMLQNLHAAVLSTADVRTKGPSKTKT